MPQSLELTAEVTTANGVRYRWDANQPPENRPTNLSFRTKVGEGFSDASVQLARRIDRDYPDLNLLDTVTFTGGDGTVAYEGRIEAMPRELSTNHSIGVTLAGWMSHARDRKMTEIYVDRDLGAWGEVSRQRHINNMTASYYSQNSSSAVQPDVATGIPALNLAFGGAWTAAFKPIIETTYDAGPGNRIGSIWYYFSQHGAASGPTDSAFQLVLIIGAGEDDVFAAGYSSTANLAGSNPAFTTFTPTGTTGRFAVISWYYNFGPAGADNASFEVHFRQLAVYGDNGITKRAGEPGEPEGVYASDVVKHIVSKYCPRLNAGGVKDTTYTIQHLVFRDPTDPYDAFLDVNKYHLWHLGVWEDQTLHFRPYDYTKADWEVRTDDPGVEWSAQGPSTAAYFNGIVVSFTDMFDGSLHRLTPDDHTELMDTDRNNPYNLANVERWDELQLSLPTTEGQALQLGRAALAERNRPKQPGTINVKGYIRDGQGNLQPCWKVRAGDTVALTDFPADSPRLITETSYDDAGKALSISVDRPAQMLDAYLDRLTTALTARGLGSVAT